MDMIMKERGLTSTERAVFGLLASKLDQTKPLAWQAVRIANPQLAREIGKSTRSAIRTVSNLVRKGYLMRTGTGAANIYTVTDKLGSVS